MSRLSNSIGASGLEEGPQYFESEKESSGSISSNNLLCDLGKLLHSSTLNDA